MGWWDSVWDFIVGKTQWDADVLKSLGSFKERLTQVDVVRCWVDGPSGYGHQSSTINILRQLCNPTAEQGFEFGKRIQIYFDNRSTVQGGQTKQKILVLLPELNDQDSGKVVGADVSIIPWTGGEIEDEADFGFTGGFDEEESLSDRLNTRYFLVLQPYQWDGIEQIQFGDFDGNRSTIDLLKQRSLGYQGFKKRAFFTPTPFPAPNWEQIGRRSPREAEIVKWITGTERPAFDFIPIYSIRSPMRMELPRTAPERMFQVVTALLQSQWRNGVPGQGARPILVVNCDAFSSNDGVRLGNLLDGTGLTEKEQNAKQIVDRKNVYSSDAVLESEALLENRKVRIEYLQNIKAKQRILAMMQKDCSFLDLELASKLWFTGKPDLVMVVQVGRIDQILFRYLLQQTTLPPVFEGQGTASIALSLGKYYLHLTRSLGAPPQYPTLDVMLPNNNAGSGHPAVPEEITVRIQEHANQILRPLNPWPVSTSDSAPYKLGTFIRDYRTAERTDPYVVYFSKIAGFYANIANDKLRCGIALLEGVIAADVDGASRLASAQSPGENGIGDPLERLLATLQANLAGGVLALVPGTFTAGAIFSYYEKIGRGTAFEVSDATIAPRRDASDKIIRIDIAGSTALFGSALALAAHFTAPNGFVELTARFTGDDSWNPAQIPWLVFRRPFIELATPDTALPTVGSVGGFVAGPDVELAVSLPVLAGIWRVQGAFAAPYPSVSKFYALATGVNLLQSLPAPLSTLAGIGVSYVQIAYDAAAGAVESVNVVAQTQSGFDVLPGLSVERTILSFTVVAPQTTRSLIWNVQSDVRIGSAPTGGLLRLGANGPGLTLSGTLVEGTITLTDILSIFLGDAVYVPQHQPAITDLSLTVTPATGDFTFSCALNIDESLSLGGRTITLNGVGIDVSRQGTLYLGGLTANLTLGTGDAAPVLQLVASYATATAWTYFGSQTSGTVSLTDLVNQFLPAQWAIRSEYAIAGLAFQYATKDGSWSLGGRTAEPWTVPFIDGLTVAASLKAGYVAPKPPPPGGRAVSALPGALTAPVRDPSLTLAVARAMQPLVQADPAPGHFVRLETEWTWQFIKLTVFFDYAPDKSQYGITWGALTGLVSGPDPKTQDYTATLRFTRSVSLGSIVEQMVSWATGSQFGLGAPWNVLDQIPLDRLALVYVFNTADSTRNKVSLDVSIGPIELGFCRIDTVALSYESSGEAGGGKGVLVAIKGSFRWQSDPSAPLAWDATKPETTPAPPGNGNKYIDLRLLALGQHVTVAGFRDAATVPAAIAELGKFPDTKPGELPGVEFDAGSAWLVGMDFGLLKIGGDGGPPATADATAGGGYVVTLQVVFNDPNLYGLRLALDGAAAKVFKGLDFQIMYRRVSDTVGVYQVEVTLPDIMRHLTVGAYTITLPVFAIQIYTNGDFLIDVGFPWNADFARSFTIEALIPPGIPVLGSAGFYFGKLSSASTNKVPAATNGTFNPVIVFGFGMQVGFGKSIAYGVLKAGFSITVVGIIEGVIAKWNPYQITQSGVQPVSQVQGDYYFWLRGTVGIVGQVYGSVDFAVIKVDVNVTVKLLLQLTYESFVSITISVIAAVDVTASVRINLGLFKITLHFSFSMTLKETFSIPNGGDAPWQVAQSAKPMGLLRKPVRQRLRPRDLRLMSPAAPNWGNLLPAATPATLSGYVAPALTMARDEWDTAQTLATQVPCYIVLLLLESTPPAGADGDASFRKAAGEVADTPFEVLAKAVLRWVVAAIQDGPLSSGEVDTLLIDGGQLERLSSDILASTAAAPVPLSLEDIGAFLSGQVRVELVLPQEDRDVSVDATVFPVPPELALSIAAYGSSYPGVGYGFGAYNSLGDGVLRNLRSYFDELAVKVEQEDPAAPTPAATAAPLSMSGFVFCDYVLLIARHMVKAAQQALRDFAYVIASGDTGDSIVGWVNANANLHGQDAFTLYDLFAANQTHPLAAGRRLTIGMVEAGGGSFETIAAPFAPDVTAASLARANAATDGLFVTGAAVTLPGQPNYSVGPADTLISIAAHFAVTVSDLLARSNVLTATGLLASTPLLIPKVIVPTQTADSFQAIAGAAAWAGGFDAAALALANAGSTVLQPAARVVAGTRHHDVQPGDTLGDVANSLGLTPAELLTDTDILTGTGYLMAGARLAVPPFVHTTAAGETLQAIAERFGIDATVLGDQPANGAIPDLFALAESDPDRTPTPTLDLPHLPRLPVGEVLKEAQRTGAIQHLSGMVSRYMLHGLRLPTAGITPNAAGMWVRGGSPMTLPPIAGIYALTGQQFPLPDIAGQDFTASLDRSAGPDWLQFLDGSGQPTDTLRIVVEPGSRDATRIAAVADYARGSRLFVPLDALGAGEMYHVEPASYSLGAATPWQSAGPIAVPYGPAPDGTPAPMLWRLPDGMSALPDPARRASNPRFALKTARYDEATGQTVQAPIAAYGWATMLPFSVKRVPAVAGGTASESTYELIGASGTDIVLLERLVAQIGGNDGAIFSLTLAFAPAGAGPTTSGIVSGFAPAVTFGLAQVNLSTETRPPAALARAVTRATEPSGLGLLNEPTEFLRLIWEASITRSGGFYLYYFDASEKRGLPDRIFNDRNEAELTLVVVHADPADASRNRIADFMNAALTVNAIDTGSTAVFVQADPLPIMIGTPQSGLGNASLAQLAAATHTDVATIARINADAALGGGAIRVGTGRFRAPPGGIALATIADRFATTVAALQAANPDWGTLPDPLPGPATIALPPLTLAGTSPHRASLRDVADHYGEPIISLAEANSLVPGLFRDPIAVEPNSLATYSLAGLAALSYDDPADVAAANADVPLAGVALVVDHGTFQAPPGGVSLDAVAQTFATTTAALNTANPGWTNGLPATLVFPAAIRLPRLSVTGGAGARTSSLRGIAAAYGTDVATLAAGNADVVGLFAGQVVTLPGGPHVRAATVPPGVQAVAAARPAPQEVPADPNAPGFAEAFLLETYALLGQGVLENVDFRASNHGLPAGPTTTRAPAAKPVKIRAAIAEADVETWDFGQSIPYSRFAAAAAGAAAGLPDLAQSPYLGVGRLLQVRFDWQDPYGNRLITDLSDPQPGDTGKPNAAPMVTGYTDPLLGLGQWPSVAASWQAGGTAEAPQLVIALSFDASRYGGLLAAQATGPETVVARFTTELDVTSATDPARYQLDVDGASPPPAITTATLGGDGRTVTLTLAAPLAEGPVTTLHADAVKSKAEGPDLGGAARFVYPDDPALRSSTSQQAALHALASYRTLFYQMKDPNGLALSVETTLLVGSDGTPTPIPLPGATGTALEAWLFGAGEASVFAFLAGRAGFDTAVLPPASGLTMTLDIDTQALNPAQIFELTFALTLTRTGGLVLGGLATTSGLSRAATRIAPFHDPSGLGTFAAALETLLSSTTQALKVATGLNRYSSAVAGSEAPLWVVRLGLTSSAGISYQIDPPGVGTPAVFAPAPISNRLQSRPNVPIRSYKTGEGLGDAVSTDFVDIDVDKWCAWTFGEIDKLLTPLFTAPMQIVGRFEGRDYLTGLLDAKKTIAKAASNLMIPVFETTGIGPDPSAAQEAFHQQILVELSNTYTTRAAVGVAASIDAAVGEPIAPRLSGNVVQRSPMLVKAVVTEGSLTSVRLVFSARLDPTGTTDTANYTLAQSDGSAPGVLEAVFEASGDSVLLTTSSGVRPGLTTVTVRNLLDAIERPLLEPTTRTIAPEGGAEPVYSLSDAKLPLASGPAALTFLVSTSALGSGAESDTGATLDLDVMFQAAQIEHQIGAVPGIEGGYQASTWLGFIQPPKHPALTAPLGRMQVPLVLRAFPATPTIVGQAAVAATAGVGIDRARLWEYECTYSLPFHYPQDQIFGEVEFNLTPQLGAEAGLTDAFAAFAEFVSVFPAVQADLLTYLAPIDATTAPPSVAPPGDRTVGNAVAALESALTLIGSLAAAVEPESGASESGVAGRGGGLAIRNPARRSSGDISLAYTFRVDEGRATLPDVADAVFCVTLVGNVPDGIGTPRIDLPGFTAEPFAAPADPGTSRWVYKSTSAQEYLTVDAGRLVAERKLVLPGLDILQRQDANATVHLTRNKELVPDRPSAEPFVYRTPDVGFASPLYPTNDVDTAIDIARIGAVPPTAPTPRSLSDQLRVLFTTLLAENLQPMLTIQVEMSYDYPFNTALDAVTLPVFMQAPLKVTLDGDPVAVPAAMIDDWVAVTELWFSRMQPKGGGRLWLDLILMSSVTSQPMPLLRLRKLYLDLLFIDPPLPVQAPNQGNSALAK